MNLFDTSEQSPVTTTAPGRERAGGRLVLMVVLGLGLLLGGAYAAAYYNAGDKVPRGTTVSGVEVGGLTPADAATTLEQGLADRVAEPIAVGVGGDTVPVDPARGRPRGRPRGLGRRGRRRHQLGPRTALGLLHRRRRPRRRS